MPPWDLDDTLGIIKLNIRNHQGQTETQIIPYTNATIIQHDKTVAGELYYVEVIDNKTKYLFILRIITKTVANK